MNSNTPNLQPGLAGWVGPGDLKINKLTKKLFYLYHPHFELLHNDDNTQKKTASIIYQDKKQTMANASAKKSAAGKHCRVSKILK